MIYSSYDVDEKYKGDSCCCNIPPSFVPLLLVPSYCVHVEQPPPPLVSVVETLNMATDDDAMDRRRNRMMGSLLNAGMMRT